MLENTSAVHLKYTEKLNQYLHTFDPFEVKSSKATGEIIFGENQFQKSDKLIDYQGHARSSKIFISPDKTFISSYWQGGKFKAPSNDEILYSKLTSAKYIPFLVEEMVKSSENSEKGENFIKGYFDKTIVEIHYSQEQFIESILVKTALEADDAYYGFGDVLIKYTYSNFKNVASRFYPTTIINHKLNGQLTDTVEITEISVTEKEKLFDTDTQDIQVIDHKVNISIEKYTKNIYFINLHHTGIRSLLVDLGKELFVAESPLNSTNGELLISEVEKIFPTKPIKYFVFGHFHPHYTGGIRPFIHRDVEIITRASNLEYLEYIRNCKYEIVKDRLSVSKKQLKTKIITQSLDLSTTHQKLIIYHIGNKSNHTNDYLIYYFPDEKMIFEDDLVWMNENTTKENIHPMTKGFYHAVKDLNIEVEQVVQTWAIFDKEKKLIFDFDALEYILGSE